MDRARTCGWPRTLTLTFSTITKVSGSGKTDLLNLKLNDLNGYVPWDINGVEPGDRILAEMFLGKNSAKSDVVTIVDGICHDGETSSTSSAPPPAIQTSSQDPHLDESTTPGSTSPTAGPMEPTASETQTTTAADGGAQPGDATQTTPASPGNDATQAQTTSQPTDNGGSSSDAPNTSSSVDGEAGNSESTTAPTNDAVNTQQDSRLGSSPDNVASPTSNLPTGAYETVIGGVTTIIVPATATAHVPRPEADTIGPLRISVGALAGLIVGIVVLLAAIVGALIFLKRRRRQYYKLERTDRDSVDYIRPTSQSTFVPPSYSPASTLPQRSASPFQKQYQHPFSDTPRAPLIPQGNLLSVSTAEAVSRRTNASGNQDEPGHSPTATTETGTSTDGSHNLLPPMYNPGWLDDVEEEASQDGCSSQGRSHCSTR